MAARTSMAAAVITAVALSLASPVARASDAGVAALQAALHADGLYAATIDGIAGPATVAAVRTLQAREGLAVDGIAGPATRAALGWRGHPRLGARRVRASMRGWDVAALQFLLARAGFPSGPFDGIAGPRFAAALARFQAWAGVAGDAVAGPLTIAALGRPPPGSPLRLQPPLGAPIGDGFGPRGARFHSGLDYLAAAGTPVGAAGSGCVAFAGYDDGYGRLVILAHPLGVTSWYAHLSRIDARLGACVGVGARLGLVGATGNATGPHLHFEVRLRGAAIDPRSAVG